MNENLEKIAQTADELDSLMGSLMLPMPDELHIEQIKEILPEKIKAIKEAIIDEIGENPWE
jgi:hypothetical protein